MLPLQAGPDPGPPPLAPCSARQQERTVCLGQAAARKPLSHDRSFSRRSAHRPVLPPFSAWPESFDQLNRSCIRVFNNLVEHRRARQAGERIAFDLPSPFEPAILVHDGQRQAFVCERVLERRHPREPTAISPLNGARPDDPQRTSQLVDRFPPSPLRASTAFRSRARPRSVSPSSRESSTTSPSTQNASIRAFVLLAALRAPRKFDRACTAWG